MGDDLITKGLKNIAGGAAAAGGAVKVIDLLESVNTKIAHLEKMMTGSLGGWDMKRVRDVQFQVYQRYHDQPDQLYCDHITQATGPAPMSVRIISHGLVRFAGCVLTLPPISLAAASVAVDLMVFGGPFMRVFTGTVTPNSPTISFVSPEPHATIAGPHQGIAAGRIMEKCELWVTMMMMNPADVADFFIYYFDRVDNP